MAKKTVFVSDLTGRDITDPVRIIINTPYKSFVLDANATDELVVELVSHGTEQKKRGRPVKAA